MILLLLHYVPAAVGLITLLIGCFAILKPKFMSTQFGIPAQGAALSYVISTGVRDIFVGFTVLALFFHEDLKLLGLILFAVGFVALGDFLVVALKGDKKMSLTHLAAVVLVFPYATWLMF